MMGGIKAQYDCIKAFSETDFTEDLKTIEAYQFLKSVVAGKQAEPGFAEALNVAAVQDAILRSWSSERWETVDEL